ncbi:uncharacterized protein LOC120263891 isoform X2 [Dioscorea cayenensis subsp. rotundata]|uniref:Uncharacterized protein LOC120263891 isoform X2 n=1 Tax=Dioscorea cayennensis subsp. rotundata TaxID=55577 RepID=A0AB40BKC2_DIOCR|nr:uncharacterized protein LOC120263891 isoform X2 [Dioscorea cayenensis subsp. rotundata]
MCHSSLTIELSDQCEHDSDGVVPSVWLPCQGHVEGYVSQRFHQEWFNAAIFVKIKNQGEEAFKHETYGNLIIFKRKITESTGTTSLKDYLGWVLELLEVVQFKSPDVMLKFPQLMVKLKYEPQINLGEDLLKNPATSNIGCMSYYSEHGGRVIDLDAFPENLWQLLRCGGDTTRILKNKQSNFISFVIDDISTSVNDAAPTV